MRCSSAFLEDGRKDLFRIKISQFEFEVKEKERPLIGVIGISDEVLGAGIWNGLREEPRHLLRALFALLGDLFRLVEPFFHRRSGFRGDDQCGQGAENGAEKEIGRFRQDVLS